MADNPRIEELRRRVEKDPASIAFAQLAEEHRRAGDFDQAVEVARAGLRQHPAYLSARVTLGRALIELGRLDEAAEEFEYVVRAAPDNLTAVRQLADIHQRRRQASNEAKSKYPDVNPGPPIIQLPPVAPVITRSVHVVPQTPPALEPPPQNDPVVTELEAWLAVLAEERALRPGSQAHRLR